MSISDIPKREKLTSATAVIIPRPKMNWRETARMLSILFKSRVVSLLLLAAVGGAFLGARGWPGLDILLLVIITGGLAASGAAGMNQYLEKDSDGLMGRTKKRPLVTGDVSPQGVLIASILMILVPSLLVLPFNPAMTFYLLLGAVIYVGIYTIWLKPRTLLNIVIGGAAGSAAVMSGGAAAGNWQDPAVISLALLVFLWTPSHFWSLAILYRNDYAKAHVPMLPVQTSQKAAAAWVFLHTGAAGLAALLLAVSPALGWLYLIPVVLVTADMLLRNIKLMMKPNPKNARALFISSNIYLMVVLLAVCIGVML
jgi:protoheme IX farnesyltransferase